MACGCFFQWWRLASFEWFFKRRAAPSGLSWKGGFIHLLGEGGLELSELGT